MAASWLRAASLEVLLMRSHAGSILCLLCIAAVTAIAEDNTLTDQEKKDGWQLLFDGKSTKGWLDSKEKTVDESHVQPDGLNPHPCNYMLIYDKPQSDFVLSLEFKLSKGCNSGVFVRTWPLTPRPGRDVGFNGIEIAIDDTKNADLHDTGAIYDLVKPSKNAMKPIGEWNKMVVTCDKSKIEVEHNGELVTKMDLDQWPERNKRPDGSAHKFDVAFKEHPRKGYIGLQDHGSDCWYRNIKLKPLVTPKE
jgi:hypothetical protein